MANDYTSIYNIKDFILNDISPKYFELEDISLLSSGLFGMINDVSSTVAEDVMRVTSRYITEIIPGQSKLPEFIYANAANFGISDIFATCAKCKALLFIKESSVLENGVADGRYQEYTIDSDLQVYIDGVPFSIPADIKIRTNYYNGQYNHRCYWDTSFVNSTVVDNLPYIKCAKTRIQGESELYIALSVTLYQYTRKRSDEPIITNTTLNIPYVEVTFEDTLCNFEVLYTSPSGTVTQLSKLLTNAAPTTKPFVYYSMQSSDTLRLSFSNDDRYFTPEYGASLEILTYETLGSKGVFPQYKGNNIYVSPKSDNSALSYNNEIPLYCLMLSGSTMGKDALTLEQIKLLTAEKQITVDSITTDNDLNTYFNTYMSIYDTKAKTIKIRDDFANRIYSCYTRLKDDENIFPTNTLNVEVELSKLPIPYTPSQHKISIPAGVRLGYKADSIDTCVILTDEDEEQDLEYTTVGCTVIDKEECNAFSYMNSVDKTVVLNYSYVNDNSLYQFIAKSLTVKRHASLGESEYTFELVLVPTDLTIMGNTVDDTDIEYAGLSEDEVEELADEGTLNIAKMKVFLFIDTNDGHYIEMNYIPPIDTGGTEFTYQCKISTSDVYNRTNIELSGLTYVPNQQVQDCYTAMQNPPIRFLVAYDEGMRPGHDYTEKIPAIQSHTLCNIFEPQTDEMYFAYPLELIRPILEFQPDTSSDYGFKFTLDSMPLVGRNFLSDEENLSKFLERLNYQHDFLQQLTITSNFGIYMRFFNTYGKSRIFTVTSGALLDKVNCGVSLKIKFQDGVEPDEYIQDIKITIKEYIEGNNDSSTSTGINDIKLSVLSKHIHEVYWEQIDYLIMESINDYGTDIQTIINDKDLSLSENLDLIPEFLTVDINDIHITIL